MFNIYLLKFIYFFLSFTGTSASGVAFQAYLLEGLARWNLQRARDSVPSTEANSGVQRSFNISLMHRLNSLSNDVHQQPSLSGFRTPPAFTGENIGMEYLRLQTGGNTGVEQELDKEIDEAFGDFTLEDDVEDWEEDQDQTVAMPDSDDSGNEVNMQ